MEHAQRVRYYVVYNGMLVVLILILMEHAQRDTTIGLTLGTAKKVLILILMEHAQRDRAALAKAALRLS